MKHSLIHTWWLLGVLACGSKAQDTASVTDNASDDSGQNTADAGSGDDGSGDDGSGDDGSGDAGSGDDGSADGSGDAGSGDDGSGDDGSGDDTGSVLDLYGEVPDKAIDAPEFIAINRDGGARDREDLLGHPTVMWFFPYAGTPG